MKFGSNKSPYVGSAEEPTDLRSFLGEGTEITGEVRFSEIMRVDSNISGTIVSDSGSLLIMEKGCVKATVQVGAVEVSGIVEGTITAKNSVKIHSTGRVYGDIYTPALIIDHGAVFDGKCHMLESKNNVTKDFAGIEQKSSADTSNLKMADAI
ncbi:MAG TPA: polymer-forming cytoskeletal protein [Blastocatellia bacterium]|jgi:cytoskeletal protein CcmA (bactofilin family)|nr:polymer-forming cytoskeletal protein [Blastocatellia bacterium]